MVILASSDSHTPLDNVDGEQGFSQDFRISPLSDVLSCLSDEINMQEHLSHEMCPYKLEFPFIRVGQLYL